MWFTTGSGRIELRLTKTQAESASHQGQCDDDVAALRREPSIRRQLDKLDAGILRDELREYGAWDDEQLSDHDENLSRILWLAAGDIVEESRQ
jgi:hypothetical protein